jgi:hypothetical protein
MRGRTAAGTGASLATLLIIAAAHAAPAAAQQDDQEWLRRCEGRRSMAARGGVPGATDDDVAGSRRAGRGRPAQRRRQRGRHRRAHGRRRAAQRADPGVRGDRRAGPADRRRRAHPGRTGTRARRRTRHRQRRELDGELPCRGAAAGRPGAAGAQRPPRRPRRRRPHPRHDRRTAPSSSKTWAATSAPGRRTAPSPCASPAAAGTARASTPRRGTGPISIHVPDGYSAELEMGTTNGPMNTGIPLTVSGRLRGGPLRTTLGSGGAPIRVVTTNGPATLNRR